MAIAGTSLQADIERVIKHSMGRNYTYVIEIHCGDRYRVTPIHLLEIDNLRDFVEGFADERSISVMLSKADYEQKIFPYREQLQITLVKKPIGAISEDTLLSVDATAKTYRAVIADSSSTATSRGDGSGSANESYAELSIVGVTFQLIDQAVEQLMMVSVGTVYGKGTPGSILFSELTMRSRSLNLPDEDAINGCTMVAADNDTIRETIPIPQGLKLHDLAGYLQNKEGGIYNGGIGCYCWGKQWYVYPPYDLTRFDKTKRTLTILAVRTSELPAMENTYRIDGDSLTVVVNGGVLHQAPFDKVSLNEGNGIRYAKANELFHGFSASENGQTLTSGGKTVAAFVGQNRQSGYQNVVFSENRITDNSCRELSKLAAKQGQFVQVNWERADSGLIVPGMPVRYLYEYSGQVYEFIGTVLNSQEHTAKYQPGMVDTRYYTSVGLTLFLNVAKTAKA